jgi:hypothetical protein
MITPSRIEEEEEEYMQERHKYIESLVTNPIDSCPSVLIETTMQHTNGQR